MRPRGVAAAGVLVLVSLACGDGTAGPSPAATAAAPTAAPTAAAATPAPTAAPTPAAPAFLDVLKTAKLATYRVTYKWSGTAGGTAISGEQSWYVKPPKSRFDFSATIGGATTRVSAFVLESATYVCLAGGGQNFCLQQPQAQALQQNPGALAQGSIGDRPDQFDPNYEGSRTIAGQTAQCYAVKPKTATEAFVEARFCYSAQGVPLLIQSKAQGYDSLLEATAFSTNVSDSDFTLPAPVQALPALPGIPTNPYNP